MKRRRLGGAPGRIALLHAIAHIELNAIDLAFDMVARFACDPLLAVADRAAFVSDWIGVGEDEARHFILLNNRLSDYDAAYGDLPAHDGLWQAAEATADDWRARLAVAPLVLEARGLDVTPDMIAKLEAVGDSKSAAILGVIYREEIDHVAAGMRWFRYACARSQVEAEYWFKHCVRERFNGALKPPFNKNAREIAGLPVEFYSDLTLAAPPIADK